MSYTDASTMGSSAVGTLTAFYDDRESADDAVEALTDAGIERNKITVVAGRDEAATTTTPEEDKGFWASLADFFMPDEDRSTYAEGLRRGGYLVTVRGLNEAESDIALDILDDEGTVDLDEREKSWRAEGWTGYGDGTLGVLPDDETYDRVSPVPAKITEPQALTDTASASRATTSGYGAAADSFRSTDAVHSTDETIPVIEEQLKVGKRDVNAGRVRVRSYVVETPVSEEISLRDEKVTIDRRPVDRAVSATDALFQDRVIEAEEHSEEAIVSKEARVTEEIGIRKEQTNRVETVSDTVRSTKVEVEDERTGSAKLDSTTRLDPTTRKPI